MAVSARSASASASRVRRLSKARPLPGSLYPRPSPPTGPGPTDDFSGVAVSRRTSAPRGGLSRGLLQAKLVVGRSDDPLEVEADRMAEADRAHPGRSRETNAIPDLQRDAASCLGYDFSRIPAHPSAASIQRKPLINTPGDRYEREADDVADKVMRVAEPTTINATSPAIQRRCADCEEREEEKLIQTARLPAARTEEGLDASAAARAATRGGTPLPTDLRAYFEPRFGHDFSQVRIHTDAEGSKAARSVQARAYTYGSDVVFGAGEYAPATPQGRRLLAHELTHVIQQGGGAPARRTNAHSAPVSPALHSGPAIFRAACAEASCPPVEFPVPAYGVIWQQAESCLQDKYREAHRGNTIGNATSWVGLTGKNPHEQATIDFFRSHYTGKGFKPKKDPQSQFPENELEREGSRQRQAEPDIFDFTDQVILEITTPAGVPYRAQKIVWEVDLANELMLESGIGGKQLWMPGFWQPSACYTMPGSAGKGYYRAWNQGGVLTYMPVSDVTNEAYLAAIAAAVAAAGKQMSKGTKGSGPPPAPVLTPGLATALLVVGAVALAILLLPEELVAAVGLAIVRFATVLLGLLGGGSLAFGAEGAGSGSGPGGGPGGQPGGKEPTGTGDSPGGTGGAGGAGGTQVKGRGTGIGSGSAGTQKQGSQTAGGGKTPAPSATAATGSAPYNETLHKLLQLIQKLNLKDGDKISPEDAERILALGEELLKQLEAADPNDPNAVALKDLIAGLNPRVAKALKKVQAASGTGGDPKGGGTKPADQAGSGTKDTQTTGSGTKGGAATAPTADPGASGASKPKGDGGSGGKGGAGKDPGSRKDPSAVSGSGLKPISDQEAGDARFHEFQFRISGFDPTVPRKQGDPVQFTINGVVQKKGFHAQVTGTFDHAETSDDAIITYIELPSVLVVEGPIRRRRSPRRSGLSRRGRRHPRHGELVTLHFLGRLGHSVPLTVRRVSFGPYVLVTSQWNGASHPAQLSVACAQKS